MFYLPAFYIIFLLILYYCNVFCKLKIKKE